MSQVEGGWFIAPAETGPVAATDASGFVMPQVAVPVEAQAPSAPLQKVKAGKNKNGIRPTEILKQLNASKDDNRNLKLEIASLEARLNVYEVQVSRVALASMFVFIAVQRPVPRSSERSAVTLTLIVT